MTGLQPSNECFYSKHQLFVAALSVEAMADIRIIPKHGVFVLDQRRCWLPQLQAAQWPISIVLTLHQILQLLNHYLQNWACNQAGQTLRKISPPVGQLLGADEQQQSLFCLP